MTIKTRLQALERRAAEGLAETMTAEEQREQEALDAYLRSASDEELRALEAKLVAEADGEPSPPGFLQVERALLLATEGAKP